VPFNAKLQSEASPRAQPKPSQETRKPNKPANKALVFAQNAAASKSKSSAKDDGSSTQGTSYLSSTSVTNACGAKGVHCKQCGKFGHISSD
jgi:hypothetical protein